MPVPTPFHERTAALCTSLRWKEWAGYHAVCSYGPCHEREYMAFRHAAGLLDVTPLYKVAVTGPDAAAFLSWVSTRDVSALSPGRVVYGPWVDDDGFTLDDGTITRRDEESFRVTSAEPSWGWLSRRARGFDVHLRDESEELAALAVQGPSARAVLDEASAGGVGDLAFFRWTRARIDSTDVEVTRTGYTGDLGYEVWIPRERALDVWDAVAAAGRPYGLEPAGLDALDVTRVEAGFILLGVDYPSARRCTTKEQKRTPFEIGLGWAVQLDRGPFLGKASLLRAHCAGPRWRLCGIEVDWEDLERLWARRGLSVRVPSGAWRSSLGLYHDGHQVGYATSGAWSPICKRYVALASLRPEHASPGTRLAMEVTIEHQSDRVAVEVVPKPFFDPARKRA